MSADSAPQPDLALKILPEFGGQSTLEGEYAAGAPELIVEVSHTTSTWDTGVKLRLYERSGVQEYIIVQPGKRKLSWNVLRKGKYRDLEPVEGLFRSGVFPGLWLNPTQLWNCDYSGMAVTIQQAAATPEHAAFVERLAPREAITPRSRGAGRIPGTITPPSDNSPELASYRRSRADD